MATIELHFRPSTSHKRTDGKIFLRLIRHRQSGNITLPYQLEASEWDHKNHCVSLEGCIPERYHFLSTLQETLDKEKESFRRFVSLYEEQPGLPAHEIISAYKYKSANNGLAVFIKYLCEELKNENRERTARAYLTSWRRLLKYSGKTDLKPTDFTEGFIKGFERLLQKEKCSLNTISFYMRNLRAIYNKGKGKGLFTRHNSHPFQNVYTKIASTRKRALTKEEISSLNSTFKQNEQQFSGQERNALFLFLFSFYACGMSFVDLADLRKSDINKNTISYYRKKTGRLIQVELSEEMKWLINYFSDQTHNSPYVFPILTKHSGSLYQQYCSRLRRQNHYLKSIMNKIGFKKNLSTHMARHSWATIARSESVSVDVISEALGHSFVSTTYIYLDSFGANVIGQANKKVSRAIPWIS